MNNIKDPIIEVVHDEVYTPSDDTYLMMDYLRNTVTAELFDDLPLFLISNILDMGTGSGIIAIFLELLKEVNHDFNARIYASDISEHAISCAKRNEKLNNINNKITFLQSDLFNTFPMKYRNFFDVIIFNPPYLPSLEIEQSVIQKKQIDRSWEGGKEGTETLERFFKAAGGFLNPEHPCFIYFISSSLTNLNTLDKIIEENGFRNEILDKKHVFFEDIILNRVKTK